MPRTTVVVTAHTGHRHVLRMKIVNRDHMSISGTVTLRRDPAEQRIANPIRSVKKRSVPDGNVYLSHLILEGIYARRNLTGSFPMGVMLTVVDKADGPLRLLFTQGLLQRDVHQRVEVRDPPLTGLHGCAAVPCALVVARVQPQ